MITEMSQSRMFFGGHTVNHPILANISREQQDFEIGETRRRTMEEVGKPRDAFSYRGGGPKGCPLGGGVRLIGGMYLLSEKSRRTSRDGDHVAVVDHE